ncbi:chloramphenicol acetyltransferase [Flavobacterium psychrophilum]|uniref:Chloramphenicol acetyltransferase n=1 Tax=Flavobacterium psychrophilum TaxID=96345 RepID=A0A7U2R9T7_FLAPS|nr:chloramphenicol acetyltransferase [Flavobacterium psychrophilum]EKT3956593.1 chloramphenicol acetyltransferase [Flavobacterium psychrophilum]EKT3963182.1 chloramphenicol acetyltransferase [Flavobacterium psychrophilum]EKT4516635.1 chloramphenicol acetyltransferase [Flavobacterium psychrophilum]ELY2017074.1 chloramphenicol acetyltransferase [Flavobacterium psychrophilum]MCB6099248.1 chloramphenicol acetyltransferase [Flavobacterium psychrophilum]
MKQKLNLDTWNRTEHFLFFKQMEEPFFGITTIIDCTNAYNKAKALNISFFAYYLHKTLVAVNSIENFRYRIIEDEIYIFDTIDASATILREDKTFGFSLIKYSNEINNFAEITKTEIARIQTTTGLFTSDFHENLIHFSALPWVNFTSFSHARSFTWPDSCPKVSFGKIIEENGKKTMAMSVHVHHGLIDGYHVGEFVNLFQELMNT